MFPISTLSNPSSIDAARSALSSAPKLPSPFSSQLQNIVNPKKEDIFERRDGSIATQDDFVPKMSGKDWTADEAAEKIREQAAAIRRDAEEQTTKPKKEKTETAEDKQVRELVHQFVGQTLYGQMIKSMRSTQSQNPYFHGGRAEEIFQGQLDMVLTDALTQASSGSLSDPIYKLMTASDRM